MKNFSLGLNIVLLAAVIFLFVKVFSGSTKKDAVSPAAAKMSAASPTSGIMIAYVELDSMNEKIAYIKARRNELESDQRNIESEWQNGYRGLENKKNEFLKRGNSITQQEAEKFQGELIQEQQQIDGTKQSKTQTLNERSYKLMDDIQKKLKDFLTEYNSDKRYQFILTTGNGLDYMLYKDAAYNITDDVIKGMNTKMSAK